MAFRVLALGAAAGLLVLLLFMHAPARLLSVVLPAEQLVLDGLSGSLWRGRAARAVLMTPRGPLHLGVVNWRLRPMSLLWFAPTLHVRSEWGGQRAAGEVSLRGARDGDLQDFEISLDAELLQRFLPLQLAGTLSASVTELSLRNGQPVAGEGRLVWQGASWLTPQGPLLLGSYGLDFEQPVGGPLRGQVVTLAGPVSAEGSVELEGMAYRIDLLVDAQGGLDPQVGQALSLLANPRADGSFPLQLEGSL